MSETLVYLGGLALVVAVLIFGDGTRQMKICISAGYEWKSGDCVKAEK